MEMILAAFALLAAQVGIMQVLARRPVRVRQVAEARR